VFAFAWWLFPFTFVRITTVAGLFFGDGVNDSIGSSAEIDSQWFFWASWWADTSFLHAHARIGDSLVGLFTDILLSLFIKITGVVESRSNFITFTNKFRVGWKSEFFTVVVTFGVSAAMSFTAASIDFDSSVLVWFTWSWGNTWWSFSLANFFVVHALTEITLVFVFVPSSSFENTIDVASLWWWRRSSGTNKNWIASVSWATVFNHTGDNQEWVFWIVTSWGSWTLGGVANANFIKTTVHWSGLLTTVWSGMVLWTWSFTVVLWIKRTVNFSSASFIDAHSLWATSVVFDAVIGVAFWTGSQ
jgi:hypothetical protein